MSVLGFMGVWAGLLSIPCVLMPLWWIWQDRRRVKGEVAG